jgi:glycosyltransferase involved in cell wall biosynthesis
MSKKLIVCSPELGIAPETNSGGEVYDREMLKTLAGKGVEVITILPKDKPYPKVSNLKVYYLPFPFIWPPYLFNLFIIPYLFYIYKKHKFNVLRVHSPYFVGIGVLIFKIFKPKIPLVVTYHHLERGKFLFNFINKLFIKKWDFILADSIFTKNEILKKYKVDEKKIKVLYCGKDDKLKPKPKSKKLIKKYGLKSKKVLMFLGELKKRKNVFFLLRLIKEIKDKDIKLLICGDGSLKPFLKTKVKSLGIEERVVFTGFVKEEKKADYYNLADIFLFPSKLEGFGMPVIEAGACLVPSIVSKKASLIELVKNGKTGYLAEFNNLKDWKEKVEKLLEDDTLRKRMGKEAKEFADSFSWKRAAEAQIKVYNNLLKKE